MPQQTNDIVIAAKDDAVLRNSFLELNELFILRCAQKASGRPINKSDDEYSIALISFNRAIDGYDLEKGDFMPFSELVIRRGLYDYFKSQKRFTGEIAVSPCAFDGQVEPDCEEAPLQYAVGLKAAITPDRTLKDEIEAVGEVLGRYGISFFDLAECSPKSEKTKKGCATAVECVTTNDSIFEQMRKTLLLPIKIIVGLTRLPRKLLERHRKYIIAASEIIKGDFPALAEYLPFKRGEGKL